MSRVPTAPLGGAPGGPPPSAAAEWATLGRFRRGMTNPMLGRRAAQGGSVAESGDYHVAPRSGELVSG